MIYNKLQIFTVELISQFVFLMLSTALVGYIVLSNLAPLGIVTYDSVTELGPKDRVAIVKIQGQEIRKQTSDLIYFSTKMLFKYDTAKVRILLHNPYPDQDVRLGFKDQEEWHYNSKIIDAPILNNIQWSWVGNGPVLYQKDKKYESVKQFFKNIPTDKIIGFYNFDKAQLTPSRVRLPNYSKKNTETVINVPLRGRHVLYAYVRDEPFKMKILKQDLNWYEDPDVVTINVYKDVDKVFTATIDDDGITDNSKRTIHPQEIVIQNPGPGLPENGLYKVVIDASGDTVIKQITTNLHKIVFEGPIFPISSDVYKPVIQKTEPNFLYTNAKEISAITYHGNGLQDIEAGGQIISLSQTQQEQTIVTNGSVITISIPKSDVIINGFLGYFAFDRGQFFNPTPFKIYPIIKPDDLDIVDFVISNNSPSIDMGGGWRLTEAEFDLSTAAPKNGMLSWLITAPKLKENNREIIIRDIRIELFKKPLDIKSLNIWK